MARSTAALILVTLLASCAQLAALLPGTGGPNVAANVQAGQENNQTIGSVSNVDPGQVDQLIINNTPIGIIWLIVILVAVGVVGWFLPTPQVLWQRRKERAARWDNMFRK